MTELDITNIIGSLGFPIAVAVWLLIRGEKNMKEMTKAIVELTMLIDKKLK